MSGRVAAAAPLGVVLVLLLTPEVARAQLLWSALDTRPRANMILAQDVSVTMQIAPNCSPVGCHTSDETYWGPGTYGLPWGPSGAWPGVRVRSEALDLTQTLDLFKDRFIFGGFRYDACGPSGALLGSNTNHAISRSGQAEISYLVAPDLADPRGSFQKVWDMINDIVYEDDRGPVGPTGFRDCEISECEVWPPDASTFPTACPLASASDPCGVTFVPVTGGGGAIWENRQQVAICATYDTSTAGTIGQALLSQPDNVVQGGGACRQNVAVFLSDAGSFGPSAATDAMNAVDPAGSHAPFQLAPYRSTIDGLSTAYLFAASPPAGGYFATSTMVAALEQPAVKSATDTLSLNVSFAEIVNRMEAGFYGSGNAALSADASRLAVPSFTVPGPRSGGAYPDESYLGRPTRLSWWRIDPKTGRRPGPSPICETDWSTRAGYSYRLLTASGLGVLPTWEVERALGPPLASETWMSGGPVLVSVADDGTFEHGSGPAKAVNPPASGGFVFGYMLNGGATQPVIVEAPHDLPQEGNEDFAQYELANMGRDRMIYTMAGGYLFAFHGGKYTRLSPPADVDGVGLAQEYHYDDSGPEACTEVFRYLPGWVEDALKDPFDPWAKSGDHINRLLPQMYTNGQITVRESRVANDGVPGDYATVLVMTEGAGGPHMAALDVTDPYSPSVLGGARGEWSLPAGDTTSAEPSMYSFPAVVSGKPTDQTVVVIPGGDGGSPNLYAYAIKRSGVLLLSGAKLPPGNYPSSAVCFDGVGRGSPSDCVVLSDAGELVRVPVNLDGTFGAAINLYPQYAGSIGSFMTGEKFYTHPAVYFTAENRIAYVFGSGDVKNIGLPTTTVNRVYKVVDAYGVHGSADASQACVPDGALGPSGVIPLGSGEALASPPTVARGIVAFTTYAPNPKGCLGEARIYGMSAESCEDAAASGGGRPTAVSIGTGIPMSPVHVRQSDAVLAGTTTDLARPVYVSGRGVGSKNQARSGFIRLYWRVEAGAP